MKKRTEICESVSPMGGQVNECIERSRKKGIYRINFVLMSSFLTGISDSFGAGQRLLPRQLYESIQVISHRIVVIG